jgi:hypothetical protein
VLPPASRSFGFNRWTVFWACPSYSIVFTIQCHHQPCPWLNSSQPTALGRRALLSASGSSMAYANHFHRTLQRVHFIVYGICESFGVLNYGAANSQFVLLLYVMVYVIYFLYQNKHAPN